MLIIRITNIDWTVYGKIAEVRKSIYNGSTTYSETVNFGYDAGGNRVRKTYWKDASPYNGQAEPKELSSTYYVRDAQGNTLSTYKKYFNSGTNQYQLDLTEQPIYGSDRIRQNTRVVTLASNATYSLLGIPLNGVVTRSEYQNWLTGLSETANVTGGTGNDFCNCKLIGLSNNSLTPHYSGTTTVSEFLGVAHNGVAVAEDINGVLQFYVVLAQQYQGQNNVCLVYDKNGKLMKGAEQIGAIEANSKPVVINYPNTGKYAIITTKQNKQAQYHVVDMGKPGYSPNSAVGEVQSANNAVSTNTSGLYGNHYTGIEHHGSGKSMLYASRYTVSPTNSLTGTTDILAYEFTNPGTAPTEYTLHSVPGCGNTERGELQISPYGDKLQWYRMDKSIAGYTYRTGYIYTLPLDATKTAVSGSVGIQGISAAGNLGDGQLETMGDNTTLLYAQRGLYKEGSAATKYGRNVWKYDPLNVTSLLSINPLNATNSYLFGEIKRGRDGKFYIPNMGDAAVGIHSYDGSANTGSVNIAQANYSITGGLPTQVLKIYADPTQTLSEYPRYVGGKVYELKDHLGNVKVTLSDEKQIVDANANNVIDNADSFEPVVVNYRDFYLGGFEMPGRKYDLGDAYRFSYQNQEKDPELFGGNGLSFKYRVEDTRLNKFFSVDPLAAKYPWNSTYAFAENRLTNAIELEGLEAIDLMNGKVIQFPTKEKLQNLKSGDYSLWADMLQWEKSEQYDLVYDEADRGRILERQEMDWAASDRMNADFKSLTITKLPEGFTRKTLYDHIRKNFGDFFKGNLSTLTPYVDRTSESLWKSDNPVGTIMTFHSWFFEYFSADDAAVLATQYSDYHWVFTPVGTFWDSNHPLAGHRQFGLTPNKDGTYTFYTRGVDMMWDMEDVVMTLNGRWFYAAADKMWSRVFGNIIEFIKANKGEATMSTEYRTNIDWEDDVKEKDK